MSLFQFLKLRILEHAFFCKERTVAHVDTISFHQIIYFGIYLSANNFLEQFLLHKSNILYLFRVPQKHKITRKKVPNRPNSITKFRFFLKNGWHQNLGMRTWVSIFFFRLELYIPLL